MPAPAARGVSPAGDPGSYDPSQASPDSTTLSGAELFGVGSLGHAHNTFDPSLTFSALGQAAATGATGQHTLTVTKVFSGSLNFNRVWNKNKLTVIYSGGDTLAQAPFPNGQFHNVSVSQEMNWKRWRLYLRDDFMMAPGASFTGTGMGGPGLLGQFSSVNQNLQAALAQGFGPSQTIQTGQAMRYVDTALGEVGYSFTRRSALTFTGSYGLLHFIDAGYISSHMLNAQAGYDYLIDPKNSIAVLASYGKIDYVGTGTSTLNYNAQLAYGRKITGRLALQIAGGPEKIQDTGSPTGNFQLLTWTVNSALKYERRHTGSALTYSRGLTNGSGVYFGAISNTFTGSLNHSFTRSLSGSISSGYAFNRGLAPAGIATTNFNNWFVGANIGHRLGRYGQAGFNYGVQEQTTPVVCPVASCGVTGYQQTFGVTVSWHLRPIE